MQAINQVKPSQCCLHLVFRFMSCYKFTNQQNFHRLSPKELWSVLHDNAQRNHSPYMKHIPNLVPRVFIQSSPRPRRPTNDTSLPCPPPSSREAFCCACANRILFGAFGAIVILSARFCGFSTGRSTLFYNTFWRGMKENDKYTNISNSVDTRGVCWPL